MDVLDTTADPATERPGQDLLDTWTLTDRIGGTPPSR
ncbi:MAG: hypothetical protein QOE98_1261, partial [Gaiellaceae bacterium]|nr:hypothetical protein [Gaiellaceae bacterium]